MNVVFLLSLALASEPLPALPQPVPPSAFDRWSSRSPVLWMGEHRMEAGETAWGLSQALGVPLPVLRELSTLDLDHLQVGDWVAFPVTEANEDEAMAWQTQEDCGC